MMRKFVGCVCLLAAGLLARAEDVSAILSRMTAAAPEFHGVSADIDMLTYTAVIDDKLDEHGTLKMQKAKNGSVRAVIDFAQPRNSARDIGLFGKTVRIYYPNANFYQDYDLGQDANVLNQFLLLGFGSSGEELARSYTISLAGTEKVAGVTTTKLLLIPKDQKVLEHLTKVELWIPERESNPIQQQFYEPTGNYRRVSYTAIRVNPSLKGTLEIQMQPGAQKRSS